MDTIIIIVAKYFFLISILLGLIAWYRLSKKERYGLIKLSVIAFPLSYLIAKLLSKFINDPRPFTVEHIHPLIPHIADNGFPSDHTLLTATIAAVVFSYYRNLGVILFILALAIGEARVMAQIHHQIDIFGAFLISIAAVYVSKKILKYIQGGKAAGKISL